MNELLADAAEKASVGAAWLGNRAYPQERLNNAWTLVMGGQFHDILPGTATPKAFQFSWNDDVIAMNQFAGVLTSATEGIAAGLNTQANGQCDRCLQSAEHCSRRCCRSERNASRWSEFVWLVRTDVKFRRRLPAKRKASPSCCSSPKFLLLVTRFTTFSQGPLKHIALKVTRIVTRKP